MKTLLVINSSGRVSRSVTRQLTQRFATRWQENHPGAAIVHRDVGLRPPSPLDEAWIAAAYSRPENYTAVMNAALAESETLIAEIEAAAAIVIGAPMYNFGMPSPLKAYFEQVIRVRRTFDFNLDDNANPYRPLLASRPVTIITSAGSTGFEPGGESAAINFLDAPLQISLSLIGLADIEFIRVSPADSDDSRFAASLAAAEKVIDDAVARLG
jgi:FMN-dependent NADH-azoreductase